MRQETQSFVPADSLPPVFTALADTPKRMKQPVLVVLVFQTRHAHRANSAVIFGERKRTGLDLHNAAVLDLGSNTATRVRVAVGVTNGSDQAIITHEKILPGADARGPSRSRRRWRVRTWHNTKDIPSERNLSVRAPNGGFWRAAALDRWTARPMFDKCNRRVG